MNEKLVDKIKGVIFGQAIGDALGLGTEFMSKSLIRQYYPNGLTEYNQIIQDKHRSRWKNGEWTDDTDQMLCVLDSMLYTKSVNSYNIARRIYQWAYNGGKDIGQTVHAVLTHHAFLSNPSEVAKELWLKSNRNNAANGGVMRTSVIGLWNFRNQKEVQINAEKVCRITHYDPRCVGSCVVVCLAISYLLQAKKPSMETLLNELTAIADTYDDRISAFVKPQKYSNFFVSSLGKLMYKNPLTPKITDNIKDLRLHEPSSIGYTLKAMGCGMWAICYAESYEDGILQIIHEGGDADTNASVAGALLGAKFGYSSIPDKWVKGLVKKRVLEQKIKQLIPILDSQSQEI